MNLRPIAVWLMIMAAESVSGLLRELFLEVAFGDRVTHQVGVAVGSLLVIAITVASIRWMRVETTRWLLGIGALWAALTFTFDAAVSRAFIDGSFERVFADYDPRRGGLMLVGMAVLALAPLVTARVMGVRDESLRYAGER
ncbi:MAG: hypothetical protein KF889_06385 [Alphaproteobacteria bacterium]|nr:hypothetical protein [Alphaproteobacteria bacterium]MCW5740446.1 hypothetical protein [Alphaproteobacteria bacterium]